MKIGVVQFPGSNCDQDACSAIKSVFQYETPLIWHKDTDVGDVDALILPGGFSYGDYLRCGAIARFSPIMKAVVDFANNGGKVLGICNGFQILCEAGLLPGCLVRNQGMSFICRNVNIDYKGEKKTIPVSHGEGNYRIDDQGLKDLEENSRVIMRYKEPLNGSINDIAGIQNAQGNVWGMMPHPERMVEPAVHGGDHGIGILKDFLQ